MAEHHRRDQFASGVPDLDDYLTKRAGQYRRRDLGVTYVLVRDDDPTVLGYHTMAMSSVPVADLPASVGRKLPSHPVPAVLIGRLAVAIPFQGQGAGGLLVSDAIERCVSFSEQIGCAIIHVHATNDRAAEFYRRLEFTSFGGQPNHLFITLATARAVLPTGPDE